MPSHEIPPELRDSSPDSSISADLAPPAATPPPTPPPLAVHRNVAAAHIHIHVQPPPELPDRQAPPTMRRLQSFDRDIAELEEDNHWPGRAYLLPVVLPQVTEPTLDELLRRVTGRTDLHEVDEVKLRVISYMVSLSRLSLFMPRLSRLDLSGSVLHSLRDLGCGLVHLVELNVSNCGLSSFDGTSGLPSVRVLIADGNMVQLVGPLSDLPLLRRLSARHNRIADLATLSFLGMCPNLAAVELQGNPVTNLILYRLTLQRSVPTLELLDGEPMVTQQAAATSAAAATSTSAAVIGGSIMEQESELSASSSPSSSLPCEVLSEASSDLEAATPQRPATSGGSGRVQLQRRPASGSVIGDSGRRGSLSLAGSPVVGSVLDVARQRKRHAWGASSSSESSTASSLSSLSSSSSSSSAPSSASSPAHSTGGSSRLGQQQQQLAPPVAPQRRRRHLASLPPLDLTTRRQRWTLDAANDSHGSELSSLEENVSN